MNYTIRQAAEKFGLEPPTLRYYEKEGILSPRKTETGIRIYSEEDMDQLEMLCCLKATGMSIKDIRRYFDLCAQGDSTVEERLEIFNQQRLHILKQIETLQKNLAKIDCKIAWYKGKHHIK